MQLSGRFQEKIPTPRKLLAPETISRGKTLIILSFVLLLITSCTPVFPPPSQEKYGIPAPTSTAKNSVQPAPEADKGLAPYYSQELKWTSCEKDKECTKVQVPIDYENPGSRAIELSVIKLAATDTRQGSLVINPGGPGGSGVDMVIDGVEGYFGEPLLAAYDIIGFDPRGVKRSAPVECLTDKERDASREIDLNLDTDSDYEKAVAIQKDFASKCQEKTGELLGFVDTVSSAKDMDILRAALGKEKLDYLGLSYGTKLGSTYARLFPTTVGKFVLDGAIDPTLTNERLALGQAKGFEVALQSWAADCSKSSKCPFSGSADAVVQGVRDLEQKFTAAPATAKGGRKLTGNEFMSGVILGMYSVRFWPILREALSAAQRGDPNPMMRIADIGADRESDGSYSSNSSFAFTAINCLDYPNTEDKASMRASAPSFTETSPTFGKYLAYPGISCTGWPYSSKETPQKITAEGAPPILVIGTTRDPATPYEWSVALREQLASGVLITREGDGHTAYTSGNTCVQQAVDHYFVQGITPPDKLAC